MLNVGGVCTGSYCITLAFHMSEVFFIRVGGKDKLYLKKNVTAFFCSCFCSVPIFLSTGE